MIVLEKLDVFRFGNMTIRYRINVMNKCGIGTI